MNDTTSGVKSTAADWRFLSSPIRMELGDTRYQSLCQLVLPRSAQPDEPDARWHADHKSHLTVRHDPDTIVVTVPTGAIGRLAGRLSTSGERGTVEILVGAAVVKGDVVPWPAPVSEKRARDELSAWAAGHHLVPNWLFQGPLQVADASVARVTLTVQRESVETEHRTAPHLPHLSYGDEEQTCRLDAETWEQTSGEVLVPGSEQLLDCGDCDETHSAPCQKCGATGLINCPVTVKCPDCDGSGQTLGAGGLLKLGLSRLGSGSNRSSMSQMFGAPEEYLERCGTCSGTGRAPCPECAGVGQRVCPECTQGRAQCPTCGGDGRVAEFRTITWHRTLETEMEISGDASLIEHATGASFVPLRPERGDLLGGATAAHEQLRRWLDLKRKEIKEDEVVRRLWVEVLPVTAVTYTEGSTSRTAYLIGPDHTVYCPGARRPTTSRLFSTWKRARARSSKK